MKVLIFVIKVVFWPVTLWDAYQRRKRRVYPVRRYR